MVEILITPEFVAKWPEMKLACIECDVVIVGKQNELWSEIDSISNQLRLSTKIEDISKKPAIQSSRKAYKACGKDPARYRLSAEALMRRLIKGNDLYQINNVVDIVNLASVSSGFSIGGYDVEQLKGVIKLGIGKANESYEGLGRGFLNIDGLPILRDKIGAFGSPTSDSLRTSVTNKTKRFLMVYFGFGAHHELIKASSFAEDLLVKYASATKLKLYSS